MDKGQMSRGRALLQEAAAIHSDSPVAVLSADAIVKRIKSDFSDGQYDSHVAQAVRDVAYQCHKFAEYEKAGELYQYILDSYPDSEHVIWAEAGIIQSDVALGNHAAAEPAIDGFIAEFKDHPAFAPTINSIEEDYYNRVFLVDGLVDEDWLRPLEMWEKVLAADPNFFYDDPDLYYFTAGCYYKLGEYEAAREYFEFTALKWPDEKMGRDAQIMLKKVEQKLKLEYTDESRGS